MNPPSRKPPGDFLGEVPPDPELQALRETVRQADSQVLSQSLTDRVTETASATGSNRTLTEGSDQSLPSDSQAVSEVVIHSRDVVVTARIPSDLHKQVKRRVDDEVDGGSLQAFILGAFKAFQQDEAAAEAIKKWMPGRGQR